MSKLPEDKRAVFTDIYKYYEQYWDMESTDENWESCAAQLGKLSQKHGGSNLVKKLLMAVYETIEADIKDAKEI